MVKLNIVLRTFAAWATLFVCTSRLYAQHSTMPSANDSVLAMYYRDQSEICDIAEIPKYVELTLRTVRPHLKDAVLTSAQAKYYAAIQATALNNLGYYFEHEGKNDQAKKFLYAAAQLQWLLGDKKAVAITVSNLGSVYENTGDVKQAIEQYYRSLKIREQINDTAGIANVYHNLANLHFSVRNFKEAEECSIKSLKYRRQLKDSSTVAFSYENLAIVSKELGDTTAAINYYANSIARLQLRNSKADQASAEVNAGRIAYLQYNYELAKKHYEAALAIYSAQNQLVAVGSMYNALCEVEFKLGNTKRAIVFAEKAKSIAASTGNILALTNACRNLSQYYKNNHQDNLAYDNLVTFNKLSDSLKNASNKNLMVIEQISHNFEVKAIQDSIKLDRDRQIFEISIAEQRSRFWYGIALLIIVAFSTVFVYTKYRQSAKQNRIIKKQKIEVEHQKQLADSRLEISEQQKQVIQASLQNLQSTQENLLLAKIKAEELSKAKSDFISHVSHEIRTPLNAILGFADLLKSRAGGDINSKYIDNILLSGKNLLDMVNELLDFSRSEAGQLQVKHVDTNLCDLLQECAHMFSHIADEKKLNFSVSCEYGLPEYCLIDSLRVRQVLYNLLGNAFRFTETGSVVLALHYNYSDEQKQKVNIDISVEDTGIGIPESQQKIIFEAFKQTEGQDVHKYGGTGLGLAIAKNIVQALNGKIEVESSVDKGSKFTIRLQNIEVLHKQTASEESSIKGKTVAVIESSHATSFSETLLASSIRVNLIRMANYEEAGQIIAKLELDLIVIALPHDEVHLKQQIELFNLAQSKKVRVLFLTNGKESTAQSLLNKAFHIQHPYPTDTQELELLLIYALTKHKLGHQLADEYLNQIDFVAKPELDDFVPRWEKIKEHKSIDDISKFASALWQFSKNQNLPLLLAYADAVLTAVEKLAIEEVYALFEKFKETLEKQLEEVK